MSISPVDPIAWVQRSRAQFFPGGNVDPTQLLAYILADVVEFGGGDCHILQRDSWWFVLSNADWLAHDSIPVPDLFRQVVPAPAHGEHSLRAEVLSNAFASDVYTARGAQEDVIKGVAPPPHVLASVVAERPGWRLVAFRLATHPP